MEVISDLAALAVTDTGSQMWQRARSWFAPAAHPLLEGYVRTTGARQQFTGLAGHPGLAYFGDCSVGNKGVLPLGAPVEVNLGFWHACQLWFPAIRLA